jgi:hypothetical protein
VTWASLFDPIFSYGLGWSSAIGCFVISLIVAKACTSQPRLSAVLALFSGAWVLVSLAVWVRLKFPQNDPVPELMFLADRAIDMASFLLVFTGCALAREAGPEHWSNFYQKWAQVGALSLLLYQMLPNEAPLKDQFTPVQQDLFFGELLGVLGFACLILGVAAVSSKRVIVWTIAVLAFYEILSLVRTHELWWGGRPFIAWWQAYLFIVARISLTGLFCYSVWQYHRKLDKEDLRKQFEAEQQASAQIAASSTA